MCTYYYPSPQFLELQKFKKMVLKQHIHVKKKIHKIILLQVSVQFSHSVMSDSLWPHGLQNARLPCPSSTLRAYSNSCPSSQRCHPTISPSVVPFSSHLQSFPASGSFPMISSSHQVGKVLELQYIGVYTANILSKYCVITSWLSSWSNILCTLRIFFDDSLINNLCQKTNMNFLILMNIWTYFKKQKGWATYITPIP